MAKTYAEKLRHPKWQKKRLEVLSESDFSCASCGDTESTLNVHHKWYLKGREPWEYDLDQLVGLCDSCHEDAHKGTETLVDVVSRLPVSNQHSIDHEDAAFILAGLTGVGIDAKNDRQRMLFKFGVEMDTELVERAIRRSVGSVPEGEF